jgi:hypothetical protein
MSWRRSPIGEADPSVSIFKRVDRHEPQIGDGGRQNWIKRSFVAEPFDEDRHFCGEGVCRRRLVVNPLPADGTRHDLFSASNGECGR